MEDTIREAMTPHPFVEASAAHRSAGNGAYWRVASRGQLKSRPIVRLARVQRLRSGQNQQGGEGNELAEEHQSCHTERAGVGQGETQARGIVHRLHQLSDFFAMPQMSGPSMTKCVLRASISSPKLNELPLYRAGSGPALSQGSAVSGPQGDTWALVHRHADPVIAPRPPDAVLPN